MKTSLEPCPACARHIRSTEETCPFCKVSIDPAARVLRARPALAGRPLSRAAVLFAAAAAASVAGCGKETKTAEPDAAITPDATIVPDAATVGPDAAIMPAVPPYGVSPIPDDGGANPWRPAPPYGQPIIRDRKGRPKTDPGF